MPKGMMPEKENIELGYIKDLNFSSVMKLISQIFDKESVTANNFISNDQQAKLTKDRLDSLVKPKNSLGKLEDILIHLSKWQQLGPTCNKPMLAIFCANHGVNQNQVSAYPSSLTKKIVLSIRDKKAAINQITKSLNIGFKLYELDLDRPSLDFTKGEALSEEEVCKALYFGMTCCEDSVDVLCLGEVGIANTCVASAITAYFVVDKERGIEVEDLVDTGAGADSKVMANKIDAIKKGLKLHNKSSQPLDALRYFGGSEIAAQIGAIIAARFARCVVVIDGFASSVAALILNEINPDLISHCLFSHRSREKGHQLLLDQINKEPYLDLNLALGEGSGSCLLFNLIKIAVTCYQDMGEIEDYL